MAYISDRLSLSASPNYATDVTVTYKFSNSLFICSRLGNCILTVSPSTTVDIWILSAVYRSTR